MELNIKIGENGKRLEVLLTSTTLPNIWSFIQMLHHIRRFVHKVLETAAVLNNLTWKKHIPADWNSYCDVVFSKLKQKPITTPNMQASNWSLPSRGPADASQLTVEGVFIHIFDYEEYTVSYSSKRLSLEEKANRSMNKTCSLWSTFTDVFVVTANVVL